MTFNFKFIVVGTMYRHASVKAACVVVGDMLDLKLEPDNPHDALAIAVYKGEHHIGYVPRLYNRQMHDGVRTQSPVECRVVERVPHIIVNVSIKDREDEQDKAE